MRTPLLDRYVARICSYLSEIEAEDGDPTLEIGDFLDRLNARIEALPRNE